ncbi:hypothetical protein J502_2808 [Acinetobacter sp. 1294596]|nr:hypothetical protein J538_2399 [Acinetobacter sp. 272263]EXE56425.1 hypothetical protein J579_2568 [Acinetobacter sp. 1239920]EXF56110.1 hypothetical protein J502_2808 [Acinetobacter sp. 1294596]
MFISFLKDKDNLVFSSFGTTSKLQKEMKKLGKQNLSIY